MTIFLDNFEVMTLELQRFNIINIMDLIYSSKDR